MFPWCLIEYEHIAKVVGKKHVLFTNVPKREVAKVKKFGRVETKSILALDEGKVCVLDPQAEQVLTPSEAQQCDAFVFGGILGDAPEQGRTERLLTSKMPDVMVRHLGPRQMPTDNAVLAVKLIVEGKPFEKLAFHDTLEIKIKQGAYDESLLLPFRYVVQDGKPFVSKKLIAFLKKKKSI